MYISLFDVNFNHITNLSHAVGTVVTKVYDFDEIKLSGKDTLDVNVSELEKAKVFRLNEDNGEEIYSGFVYKAKKKHDTVEIIGNDFRTLLDNEIMIDYFLHPTPADLYEFLDILVYVFNNQIDVKAHEIDYAISFSYSDVGYDFVDIFGEIPKEPKVINFYKFIIPYIKYYDTRLISYMDWESKQIIFHIYDKRENHRIRLKDFEYDLSQNQPSINKTIAIMKFAEFGYKWVKQELTQIWQDVYPETIQWSITQPSSGENYQWVQTGEKRYNYEWKLQKGIEKTEGYHEPTGVCPIGWDTIPLGDGTVLCQRTFIEWHDVGETTWSENTPQADQGYRWVKTGNKEIISYEWKLQEYVDAWQDVIPEVIVWSQTEPEDELQENERWFNTGETLDPIGATRYYYLTTDNQIIESDQFGDIPNRYYPVKTKIYTNEYLANAQYEAIMELANQRYVDSITIDANSPLNPIDLSDVALFDLIEIYDNNYQKVLPVSEKELKIDTKGISFKLKLGFKKEKITDIIKAGR